MNEDAAGYDHAVPLCLSCGAPLTPEYLENVGEPYCPNCLEVHREQVHAAELAALQGPIEPEIYEPEVLETEEEKEARFRRMVNEEVARVLWEKDEADRQAEETYQRTERRVSATMEIVGAFVLFFVGVLVAVHQGWERPFFIGLLFACIPAGWMYIESFWGTTFVIGSCGLTLAFFLIELAIKLVLSFVLGIFVVAFRLIRALINLID